jgi:hypothetical protein
MMRTCQCTDYLQLLLSIHVIFFNRIPTLVLGHLESNEQHVMTLVVIATYIS